jgi:membrane protein implicated in regulation of membrane protease activity
MKEWLGDTDLLVWLGIALALGLAEMTTLNFVFVMFAAGAAAAAVTAGASDSLVVQTVVFAAISTVLLVAARPPLRRWSARSTAFHPTNVHALSGRRAEALSPVTHRDGTVKLAGETWSARQETEGVPIEPGSPVHVVRIDGATAIVRPVVDEHPSAE